MFKKHTFTLLEVIIALSLFALMLSSLTITYRQFADKKLKTTRLKEESLSIERMRQRLLPLWTQITDYQTTPFHTEGHPQGRGNALFFSYFNELDLDPAFCTELKGCLYLNKNHCLYLTLQTPTGQERTDLLLEGVATFTYAFFNPETALWQDEWSPGTPLPPFFTIEWTLRNTPQKKQRCAFFLPRAEAQIIYSKTDIPPV